MRTGLVILALLFFIAGCGRSGPGAAPGGGAPKPAANSPEQVVTAYLNAIGRSDYRRAAGYLEHPQAAVWPGVGLLEETFSAKVPPDVVRLTGVAAGPTFTVSAQGDEVCCLARAHIAPGKEAHRWGIGQEGDWQFAFYLIKRDGGWRLARGMPISTELADYLAGNRNPFQNVVSQVPAVAARGKEYKLAFDLHLPKALAFVEEVDVALLPEPGTEKYPYSYETAFSTYWYGPGGQKNLMGHFDQTVEIDPEMPPGKYRLYLGLGTGPPLYWAVPPYVVTVK
jgi:predicted small lipoprotein YifL